MITCCDRHDRIPLPIRMNDLSGQEKALFALTYYVFKEYNASFNGSYEYER